MRTLLAVAIRGLLPLIPLLGLPAAHAHAEESTPAMERVKQDQIYQSKGVGRPEGYIIDRSLLTYGLALGEDFIQSLKQLGPEDRWLDIGAGEGRAIIDYTTARYDAVQEREGDTGGKGQAVGLSIEDRRTSLWHETAAQYGDDRMQYRFGKPLRDYSLDELGRFQVISDVMGGFSYAEPLSVFMQKTLALLVVQGSFYAILLDVHSEGGSNAPHYAGSPFRTHIADTDGKEVKVCAWLKRISCVEVSCEFRDDWAPPVEVYRVRKVCEQVSVPELLAVRYEAGTPPERGYRLVGGAAPQPKQPAAASNPSGGVRTVSDPR